MLKRRPGARWTVNPLDEVRAFFWSSCPLGAWGWGKRSRDRPSDGSLTRSLTIDQAGRIDERRVVGDEERSLGDRIVG